MRQQARAQKNTEMGIEIAIKTVLREAKVIKKTMQLLFETPKTVTSQLHYKNCLIFCLLENSPFNFKTIQDYRKHLRCLWSHTDKSQINV